jgi:hypothetical protein
VVGGRRRASCRHRPAIAAAPAGYAGLASSAVMRMRCSQGPQDTPRLVVGHCVLPGANDVPLPSAPDRHHWDSGASYRRAFWTLAAEPNADSARSRRSRLRRTVACDGFIDDPQRDRWARHRSASRSSDPRRNRRPVRRRQDNLRRRARVATPGCSLLLVPTSFRSPPSLSVSESFAIEPSER